MSLFIMADFKLTREDSVETLMELVRRHDIKYVQCSFQSTSWSLH